MEAILQLDKLTKHYRSVKAVQDLSFKIHRGNVYGILGPNGSGKSTTLGMILNVVNPTSGDFKWFNGSFSTHEALKKVGAIIEHPNFYPYMTAAQNLKLVCDIKEVHYEKIEEKLKVVGLDDRKNSKFSSFSLGMKQRLAIASALLNDPEILILDEPTNGLDPQGIHQIRQIIKDIAAGGTTILLASHLLDEVEKVCSHVLIIREGKKLYSGPVDELQASHGYFVLECNDFTRLTEFIDKSSDFKSFKIEDKRITAFLAHPLEADALNKTLYEQGITLTHLVKRKESLEEQFLQLTKNTA